MAERSPRCPIPALILNLARLTAISALSARYWSEQRIVSVFVRRLAPSESGFAAALDLAGLIHAQVPRGAGPPFILIATLDMLAGTPV